MSRFWDELTIEKIRRGYYTAVYFNRTKDILISENNKREAIMQIFQRNDGSILCGVDETVELFKLTAGYYSGGDWIDKRDEITIRSLSDGDKLSAFETVMHVKGPYAYFAHLESVYLGILARRTMVATAVSRAKKAANNKPVIFFSDRFDYFANQEGDGYAAKVGGADGVCTQAMAKGFGKEPSGTIPHALIALNHGDSVTATFQFAKNIKNVEVIALVDFDNDCVKTSLEIAHALKSKLWGVRLDTAPNVIDKSIVGRMVNDGWYTGVNPTLVNMVRDALDKEGYKHVKIVVSGGFSPEKISAFEKAKAPVDVYGVGSYFVHQENDFTADIVEIGGKRVAKYGREYRDNKKMNVRK